MFDWQAELGATVPVPVSVSAEPVPLAIALVKKSAPAVTPKPSFAQALRGPTVTYSDPLPASIFRGETLSIHITKDAYLRGLEACRTNLRGRLMLNKGDKAYSSRELFSKLQTT
jgi:hypothetical protein